MRKHIFALAGVVAISLLSGTSFAFAWMPGDNPWDPGCNVNVGGNCGRQLDAWNNTWRHLGYPLEPGRGAYGTYLPGGGYVPNGRIVVIQRPAYGYGTPPHRVYGGVSGVVQRILQSVGHRSNYQGRRFVSITPSQAPAQISDPLPQPTSSDYELVRRAYAAFGQ